MSAASKSAAGFAEPSRLEPQQHDDPHLLQRRVEDLAQGFVAVTSELWIVKDRLAVLEQVLARHGIDAQREIDAFEPAGEFKTALDTERRAWAQRMIGALFPRGLPKTE